MDGTRTKAVNNKDRNFTRASLAKFMELADAKLAAIRERRTRCKDMLVQLDVTGEDQISLTCPDSRAMAAHTHVAVSYNVQAAVDSKHKLIVEQRVTNQVVDMGLLTETAAPAKEVLGVETIEVVADKGYFKIEDIEACEEAGIVPYVATAPTRPFGQGRFCPQGRVHLRRSRIFTSAGGSAFASLFRFAVAWSDLKENQLRQQAGLRRLRDPLALHGGQISHGLSS